MRRYVSASLGYSEPSLSSIGVDGFDIERVFIRIARG